MGATIQLTEREIRVGVCHGCERVLEDFFKGETYAYGHDKPNEIFDQSISGALGEIAFCKYRDKYPAGIAYKGADDARGFEIRTITDPSRKLLLRERDEGFFVLVIDKRPIFEIVGYLEASQGKKDEFLYEGNGRPPCWLVPQDCLIPFVNTTWRVRK